MSVFALSHSVCDIGHRQKWVNFFPIRNILCVCVAFVSFFFAAFIHRYDEGILFAVLFYLHLCTESNTM